MHKDRDYGVIFDMDGVLIDSYEAHKHSWQRMAAEYGLEMTDEQFAATFGRKSRQIILDLWHDRIEPHRADEMDARKEKIFREFIGQRPPVMPGAVELLNRLAAAGFKVGLGSSGPPENVHLIIEKLGIGGLLHGVVTGADVARGKPDPQVFLLTAQKMAIAPDRCAVIEDAAHGITAARRAGMKAVGLTGTATRGQLGPADLVIDGLAELDPQRLAALIDT